MGGRVPRQSLRQLAFPDVQVAIEIRHFRQRQTCRYGLERPNVLEDPKALRGGTFIAQLLLSRQQVHDHEQRTEIGEVMIGSIMSRGTASAHRSRTDAMAMLNFADNQ